MAEKDGVTPPDPDLVMSWDRSHLIGGAIQTLAGASLLYIAMGYNFGSSFQMGAGYFPRVLSVIFILLGLATMATARRAMPAREASQSAPMNWRPPLFIFGSILLFMLMIERVGFVATIFAVTICARLADREGSWMGTLIVAAVTTVINVLIFIVGLRMPLQLWW